METENRYRVMETQWNDFVPQVKFWFFPIFWFNMVSVYTGFRTEEKAWNYIKKEVDFGNETGKKSSEL